MTTIKEIAKEAGVAISTVSNVLNCSGKPAKVGEETCRRVREIAARNNYVASSLGKALRKGKSYTVAALGRIAFYDAQTANALDGVEKTLRDAGYSLLFTSEEEQSHSGECLARLLAKGVDGVILIGKINDSNRETFRQVAEVLPTVKVFAESCIPNVPSVFVDVTALGNLAADCLHSHGHNRIMLLGDRPGCRDVFRRRMAEYGVQIPDEFIFPELESFDAGREAIRILTARKLPVSAIFCYNDNNAAGVLYEAAQCGIKIPRELSVLGVGDLDIASRLHPLLSTIELPQRKQGCTAAATLLRLLEKNTPPAITTLQPHLVLRDSIATNRI